MTTQPKRLTAEEEARQIANHHVNPDVIGLRAFKKLMADIEETLRQRDELYAKALEECSAWRRGDMYSDQHASGCIVYRGDQAAFNAHDAARKAAGLEDA